MATAPPTDHLSTCLITNLNFLNLSNRIGNIDSNFSKKVKGNRRKKAEVTFFLVWEASLYMTSSLTLSPTS